MDFEIDSLYKNPDYFLTCDQNDSDIISGIFNATESLEPDTSPFHFYDIGLTDQEQSLLSELNIENPMFMTKFQDWNSLSENLYHFMEVAVGSFRTEEYTYLAGKIIRKILSSLGQEAKILSLFCYEQSTEDYFPDWHVDKTSEQIYSGIESDIKNDQQYVYIFNLKGNATLYQIATNQQKQQFYSLASSASNSFGYSSKDSYVKNEGIDQIFHANEGFSAQKKQGSVHLSGYDYGAIHASAAGGQRMILVIKT